MTYNDQEISTQDGRPVSLYMIKWDKTVWRYTSGDRVITRAELVAGVVTNVDYLPVAISDEGMVQGGGSGNNMTVDIPANLPICDAFRAMPPSESIWLTVRRIHDDPSDAPIYWLGLVSNLVGKDPGNSQIIGVPISATFKRNGLRLAWGRGCPHTVYDPECRLNPEDFRTDIVIHEVSGNQVSMVYVEGMFSGSQYRGGFIEWEVNADGTRERRAIEEFVSDAVVPIAMVDTRIITFQVFGVAFPLAEGQACGIFPGCNLTPEVCQGTFNNLANHGGFKFLAGRSPFDGEPVF